MQHDILVLLLIVVCLKFVIWVNSCWLTYPKALFLSLSWFLCVEASITSSTIKLDYMIGRIGSTQNLSGASNFIQILGLGSSFSCNLTISNLKYETTSCGQRKL